MLNARVAELTAAYEAARDLARRENTQVNRQAVVDTSRALSDFMVANDLLPKARGYASRAGKRQHAEQRAMALESMQRQAIRNAFRSGR